MPIRGRQKSFTGFYHVVVRGINRENTFNEQREKLYLKKIILEFLGKYKVEIYAYCIMSNHAHLLIKADVVEELSSFMARILAKYATYYNFKHNRNGHVFQNRFMSECVETEAYFWNCVRYIHLNPVKAKMINDSTKYKYSSKREYFSDAQKMISLKAIEMCENRFVTADHFQEFHLARQRELFVDIAEEMKLQKSELARAIAEEMFKQYRLNVLNQVFEEKEIQIEYIERIRETLKISKRAAREICIAIKNDVENE